MYAILPIYFSEIGLLPIQVGLILSINRWIRLLTNHIAERAIVRYNMTILLTAALLLGSVITLAYATFSLFSILLIARMLWGLCWSFLRQIGMMTAVNHAPEKNIAQVMGYYHGLARIGSVSGLLFGGVLFDLIGFDFAFLILGIVSITGIPLGSVSQKGAKQQTRSSYSDKEHDGSDHIRGLLICGFVLGCVGSGLIMASLGAILKHSVGASVTIGALVIGVATLNGLLLGGRWILESLCAPLLGALNDRIGRYLATFIFFIIGTISLFALGAVSNILVLLFLILIFFISGTSLATGIAAEVGRRGPKTIALYASAWDLGSAVGPIISWSILEFVFSPDIVFTIGGAFYLIATVTSWLSLQKRGEYY
jgi:MFS family permease